LIVGHRIVSLNSNGSIFSGDSEFFALFHLSQFVSVAAPIPAPGDGGEAEAPPPLLGIRIYLRPLNGYAQSEFTRDRGLGQAFEGLSWSQIKIGAAKS
jgi:hypothetical protein